MLKSALLLCFALFAAPAHAQNLAASFTPTGADVEWMAATVLSAPSTGQTGDLILTLHAAESPIETFSEMCIHLATSQLGATVTLVLYEVVSDPTDLLWSSDPIDASTTGRKCVQLGDDGGTITTAGTNYFNASDELELVQGDVIAKGRVKVKSDGTQSTVSERVLGTGQKNIGFGVPGASSSVVPSIRGYYENTVVPPAVFGGAPSTTIDAPYLPFRR